MNTRFQRTLALFVIFLATGPVCHSTPESTTPQPEWLFATAPREFSFPEDHHAHQGFRTEWWYFTGNLEIVEGPRVGENVGFQFTLFRQGVRRPGEQAKDSRWLVDAFGFGHAALSLPSEMRFLYDQVMERGALGGLDFPSFQESDQDPDTTALLARVASWEVERIGLHNFAVRADFDGHGMDLELRAQFGPIFHGDAGFSRKGPGHGNASFYYTLPRLDTEGTITLDGSPHIVRGTAWLDREWGSNQLASNQKGWDWFALQFDDGRNLMVYQIRLDDGDIEPLSHGTLRLTDGTTRPLVASQYSLTPLDHWTSPETGGRYPIRWRLDIPSEQIHIVIEATQEAQELALQPISYYEGSIRFSDESGNTTGRGYMELTGYAEPIRALSDD